MTATIDTESMIRMHMNEAIDIFEIESGQFDLSIEKYLEETADSDKELETDWRWMTYPYHRVIWSMKRAMPEGMSFSDYVQIKIMHHKMKV